MRDKTIYVKWEQSTVTFTFVNDVPGGSIESPKESQAVDRKIGLPSDTFLRFSLVGDYSSVVLKVGNKTKKCFYDSTQIAVQKVHWDPSSINEIANKDSNGNYLDTTFTITRIQ